MPHSHLTFSTTHFVGLDGYSEWGSFLNNNYNAAKAWYIFKEFMKSAGWTITKSGLAAGPDLKWYADQDILLDDRLMFFPSIFWVMKTPDNKRELLFYRSPIPHIQETILTPGMNDIVAVYCSEERMLNNQQELVQFGYVMNDEAPVYEGTKSYSFNLDSDPGWYRDGLWDFGQPQGLLGDPYDGYSGTNVFGTNLNGTYGSYLLPQYLITDALDCSSMFDVMLQYKQWLGIESFDKATLAVSTKKVIQKNASLLLLDGTTVYSGEFSQQSDTYPTMTIIKYNLNNGNLIYLDSIDLLENGLSYTGDSYGLRDLVQDDSYIFATTRFYRNIAIISKSTFEVVGWAYTTDYANFACANSDGYLYCTTNTLKVLKFNIQQCLAAQPNEVGPILSRTWASGYPRKIRFYNNELWLSSGGSGFILEKINQTTLATDYSLTISGQTQGFSFEFCENYLWVNNHRKLFKIDKSTYNVINSTDVYKYLDNMIEYNNKLYCSGVRSNIITVFDTTTLESFDITYQYSHVKLERMFLSDGYVYVGSVGPFYHKINTADNTMTTHDSDTWWHNIWTSSSDQDTIETEWSNQIFDISEVASYQPEVYIRWGLGPTDINTEYAGWNVDDIEIYTTGERQIIIDSNLDFTVSEDEVIATYAPTTNPYEHPHYTNVVYYYSLSTDIGWTKDTGWEFGNLGLEGEYLYTGVEYFDSKNGYGYNLSGNYQDNLSPKYLTSTAIDCSELTSVLLKFKYVLQKSDQYDIYRVEVSNNGTDWHYVKSTYSPGSWANIDNKIKWDSSLYSTISQEALCDITTYAAGQETVYIRWRIGPTNGSGNNICWRLYDVSILERDLTSVYLFDLSSDPGWTKSQAFYSSLGIFNPYGDLIGYPYERDFDTTLAQVYNPNDGYTGANIAGIHFQNFNVYLTPLYFTTTAIDCSALERVYLQYKRWSNIVYNYALPYAQVYFQVQISTDNSNFTTIKTYDYNVVDYDWQNDFIDISSYAAKQSTIYIRWKAFSIYNLTHTGFLNIDDVEILTSDIPLLSSRYLEIPMNGGNATLIESITITDIAPPGNTDLICQINGEVVFDIDLTISSPYNDSEIECIINGECLVDISIECQVAGLTVEDSGIISVLSGLENMTEESVGHMINIQSTVSANNGNFLIIEYISQSSVRAFNQNGFDNSDPDNGFLPYYETFSFSEMLGLDAGRMSIAYSTQGFYSKILEESIMSYDCNIPVAHAYDMVWLDGKVDFPIAGDGYNFMNVSPHTKWGVHICAKDEAPYSFYLWITGSNPPSQWLNALKTNPFNENIVDNSEIPYPYDTFSFLCMDGYTADDEPVFWHNFPLSKIINAYPTNMYSFNIGDGIYSWYKKPVFSSRNHFLSSINCFLPTSVLSYQVNESGEKTVVGNMPFNIYDNKMEIFPLMYGRGNGALPASFKGCSNFIFLAGSTVNQFDMLDIGEQKNYICAGRFPTIVLPWNGYIA